MEVHDNRPASYTTWTTKQVVSWLQGLDDFLDPYSSELEAKGVDGKWLNTATPGELKKLGVDKVGHQMIIMDKIRQLQTQYASFDTETMQTILFRVSRACVCIVAAVKSLMAVTERQDSREPDDDSVYPGILDDIQDAVVYALSSILTLMSAVKSAVFWLERPPFLLLPDMNGFRQFIIGSALIVNRSAQLAISTQLNSHFIEVLSYVESVRDRVEEVIQNCADSIMLTPCSMELVHIRKIDTAGFGFNFQSTLNNVHVIVSVQGESPAFCSGKVNKGDEVIEVNDQVVIGWQHRRVADLMRLYPRRITLRLRKRPAHSTDFTGFPGGGRRHRIVMASGPQNPAAGTLSQQLARGGYLFTRTPKRRAPLSGALMNEPLTSTQESATETGSTTSANATDANDVPETSNSSDSHILLLNKRSIENITESSISTKIIEPIVEDATASSLTSSLIRSPSVTTTTSSSSSSRCASVKLPGSLKGHLYANPLDVSSLGDSESAAAIRIDTMTTMTNSSTTTSTDRQKPSSCRGSFQQGVLFQPNVRMISSTPCTPLMTTRMLKSGSVSSSERPGSNVGAGGDSADDWDGGSYRPTAVEDIAAVKSEDDARYTQAKSSASTVGTRSIFPRLGIMHRRTASGGPSLSLFNSGSSKETTPNDSGDNASGSYSHRGSGANRIQAVDKRHRNFMHRGSLEDIGRLRKLVFGPRKASRRISCKELGCGDCQGWLWLKKSNAFVSKYVKRWCVFKHSTLYYYRNPEDDCAEGLILLHGFTVTPVPEVKSGRYGFYVFNEWVRFHFASESELDRSKWMNVLGLAAIGLTSELQRSRIGGFHPGYVIDSSSASGQGGPTSLAPKLVLIPSPSRPHSAKGHPTAGTSGSLETSQTEDSGSIDPQTQPNTDKEQSTETGYQPRSTSVPFTLSSELHFPSTRQLPPTNKQQSASPHRTRRAQPHTSFVLAAVTSAASPGTVAAISYSESEEDTEPEVEVEDVDQTSGPAPTSSLRSTSSGSPLSLDGSLRLRSSSPDSSHTSLISGDSIRAEFPFPRALRSQAPRRLPLPPQLLVAAIDSSSSSGFIRNPPSPGPQRHITVRSHHQRLRAAQLICDRLGTPKQTNRPENANHSVSPC